MRRKKEEQTELGSRLVARVLLVLAEAPAPIVAETTGGAQNGTYNGRPPETLLGEVRNLEIESDHDMAPSVSSGSGAPTLSHPLLNLLTAAGHHVTWTTCEEWMLDTHGPLEHHKPQVVIVESSGLPQTTTELCRELRESKIGRHAAVLIVVPSGRKNDRARTSMINGFIDAGADDFFPANAPDLEILSRVRCLAGLARVRSDLENAREQLRLQMQNDDLTKLLNRRFFFQAAHRECGRARRYNSELSCLMIEIDHFKRLTSMLGFECGDVMLRSVSGILRDYTRDSDIVARFDEEKFVIVLPETDINGAMMLREKIQRAVLEEQLTWHDRPLPLSVSLGEASRQRDVSRPADTLSPLPDEENDGEHVDGIALSTREELAELLESADAALFVAKRGVRFPSIYVEPLLKKRNEDLESFDELPSID